MEVTGRGGNVDIPPGFLLVRASYKGKGRSVQERDAA